MDIKHPILITGVPRSGTSLTAGLFHQAGAWGGRMIGGNKDNLKGFFENIRIRQEVTKGYLIELGEDPMGQDPLPSATTRMTLPSISRAEKMTQDVETIVNSEGYGGGQWFYKDAKIALTWAAWACAFPDAHWVLVRRKSEAIAESCMKTGFMRVYQTKEDWLNWIIRYEASFEQMKANLQMQLTELWFEDIVGENWGDLRTLIQILNLKWDEEKISEFIIR